MKTTPPQEPAILLALEANPNQGDTAHLSLFTAEAVSNHSRLGAAERAGEVLRLSGLNEVVFLFFRAPELALELAPVLSRAARSHAKLPLKFALHSGALHPLARLDATDPAKLPGRLKEIAGMASWLLANSAGIRETRRLAECGSPGQILVSASYLALAGSKPSDRLHPAGQLELQPGKSAAIFNFVGNDFGVESRPNLGTQMPATAKPAPPGQAATAPALETKAASEKPTARVLIITKPHAQPDDDVARQLHYHLSERGFQVTQDLTQGRGLAWAKTVEEKIRNADVVLPLVSEAAAQSELFAYEVETADATSQEQNGRPQVWPIRVDLQGLFPDTVSAFLTRREFVWDADAEANRAERLEWNKAEDQPKVLEKLIGRLSKLPKTAGAPSFQTKRFFKTAEKAHIEPVGGAVPLDSKYYITRATDGEFADAISNRDSIVLIKGSRQMGKTSLLGRGLRLAKENGTKIALSDFQKFENADFSSLKSFYQALCDLIGRQLDVDPPVLDQWERSRSANTLFEDFWRSEVLEKCKGHVLWACDEFDRLLTKPFGTEVCALLRSWHNDRVLDPEGPWSRLTIAIAYATEAHLFITDLNQSPFNVGTRLNLEDFDLKQVSELNQRYGAPLATPAEVGELFTWVGGHPYLVRRSLNEIAQGHLKLKDIPAQAENPQGIFADHLQRILILLAKEGQLRESVRKVLQGQRCGSNETFYRLRSAGLLVGSSEADAHWRCQLYQKYLKAHLDEV